MQQHEGQRPLSRGQNEGKETGRGAKGAKIVGPVLPELVKPCVQGPNLRIQPAPGAPKVVASFSLNLHIGFNHDSGLTR